MISYIKGKVEYIGDNFVVAECNGIGYRINVSELTISKLGMNKEIKIFTYMQVRENDVSLFGFLTNEEIEMFHKLINVSGLGAKSAVAILSVLTPSQIMLAIVTDDILTLSKAPGVGKKTAQRIVLDLKDKIQTQDAVASMASSPQEKINMAGGAKQDAIEVLLSFGYIRSEAVKAVMEIAVEGLTTEQIIKQALKKLSNSN